EEGQAGEETESESSEVPVKRVKRKTSIACYSCRKRKMKCNGMRPVCSNCEKRQLVCDYAPVAKRR
ncbi:hypothetical protein K474DRAFT_1574014, partial [Panus rudis PR-1116 ss-1]